jgi:hypothetical protein
LDVIFWSRDLMKWKLNLQVLSIKHIVSGEKIQQQEQSQLG